MRITYKSTVRWLRSIHHPILQACILLLCLSIWPGHLDNIAFLGMVAFGILLVTPVGWLIFLVLIGLIIRQKAGAEAEKVPKKASTRSHQRSNKASLKAVVLTLLLLFFQVPRSVGFLVSWRSFSQALRTYEHTSLKRHVGLYKIRRVERGGSGSYFTTGFSGIGSSHAFHGFVHLPDATTTPFGSKNYRTHRIIGNWHVFKVTDENNLDL